MNSTSSPFTSFNGPGSLIIMDALVSCTINFSSWNVVLPFIVTKISVKRKLTKYFETHGNTLLNYKKRHK